ncbi:3-phosphoshikimate 1-carboxyvinyltransferase, partial [Streptococcus orisratti]|uniref:3-phosphoshikimate 1-carboxyvinyltransferase n=1 Tax=Streptococcus orisratti TaxID=114652 RepID=UPI0029437303
MTKTITIFPSKLKSSFPLYAPPSKSHTMRALLLLSLANGSSKIINYLKSNDTLAMIETLQANGCHITTNKNTLEIIGNPNQWKTPHPYINAKNSGQIFRFCTSQAARSSYPITITGDHSIRNNRPIQPLLQALSQLNCTITHLSPPHLVPFEISGPINPGEISLIGQDSQIISSLLMVLPFLNKSSIINVVEPGETPWIDLTLYWLKKLGANIDHYKYTYYHIQGNLSYSGFEVNIPSDFSSMAFLIAIAITNNMYIEINDVDFSDIQGDKKFIDLLITMGAKIQKNFTKKSLKIFPSLNFLKGVSIDINPFIDAIPILAVIACFAKGTTKIYNGSIAKNKESNRLKTITQELLKMNANIQEMEDGLIIHTSKLSPCKTLYSHNDHRIAMALIVASLTILGESCIKNISCINKSFPDFINIISSLGG